jgi:nicotinamidase-related amidase
VTRKVWSLCLAMRQKNKDLHGNAPDQCRAALLVVDMFNDFEFPEGEILLDVALPVARRVARLADRARASGVPVIFANDNYGRWRSDLDQQLEHVLDGSPGAPIARLLAPRPEDYYVIKPKHSGFYETTLGLLLGHLGAETLVITGVCTEACVLFTANDAYMRDFELVVPPDGVASFCADEHDAALRMMERLLKAALIPCEDIDFAAMSAPHQQEQAAADADRDPGQVRPQGPDRRRTARADDIDDIGDRDQPRRDRDHARRG